MVQILDNAWQTLAPALSAGNPPLYIQLLLGTMVFIILRLYMMVRRWRRAATPPNEWLTGSYIALLALLSFGVWDYVIRFYDEYFLYVLHVYNIA